MKNRINRYWDQPHIPIEVREQINRRDAVNTAAAMVLLKHSPRVTVTFRTYDNPHPIEPSRFYRNTALFVGGIQVICLESIRMETRKQP